jgi:probable rRNA maturation factor
MADKLRVIITDCQKEVKIPTGIRMLIRRCCHAILETEGFKGSAEIGITFTEDKELKKLSLQYFGKETDEAVISLPAGENGEYDEDRVTGAKILGSIVISVKKAVDQSKAYDHSFQREMAYLTAHGVLGLLGYSYDGAMEKVSMREKEEWALYQLGLPASRSYF